MTSLALVQRQRGKLRALHRETTRDIRTAWTQARAQVTPALGRFTAAYGAELARVCDDADDDTAHVSLVWLHTSGHLASLRAPMQRAVTQAAHASLAATLAGQHQAYQAGQQSALALMRAIPGLDTDQDDDDDSDHHTIVVPPLPPLGTSSYSRASLGSIFDQLPPNAWQKVQQTANAGAATGQSAADLLAALLAILGSLAGLAILWALGELTGAFRGMLSLSFQANPDAVTGWVWICSFDNSCAACIAMHGSVHDASEDLDSHPNCACVQMPFSGQPPDMQSGEDWFNAQDADTQRDIIGPAALQALQLGDLGSISDLIDTSDGYVSQASLASLGLNAGDYLT